MPTRKRRVSRTRARKLSSRKSERELQQIENLLGEDFETLAQAHTALRRESGPKPYKDKYSVRELSSKRHKTLKQFLPDLSHHAREIDALKHPTDLWAAEIKGKRGWYKTYKAFDSIEGLSNQIGKYKDLLEEFPSKVIDDIRVVRVKNRKQWHKAKQTEIAERKQYYAAKAEKSRKEKRKSKKRMRYLERKVKDQAKLIKKLQRTK